MITRLTKLILGLLVWSIDQLKKIIYRALGKKTYGTCVIIYYHAITPAQRRRFALQMDDLIRWAKPFSIEDTRQLETGVHHVGVTFDDGFTSVLENALPDLVQRKIPSTIFVPTGYLGQKSPWIEKEKCQDYNETVITTRQLEELNENAWISIGSHCVTHPNLLLLSEEEARNEIFQSKHDLEDILQKRVNVLSFPHGAFNQACLEWARDAGYKAVFSIIPSLAFSNPSEYLVGRIRIDPDDWRLESLLKLLGCYRWLPSIFLLKKKLRKYIEQVFYSSPPVASPTTLIDSEDSK
jgi:peptidoglycan/xylan/chitin deacetylase (PgdA/CDA1 family)